MNPTTNTITKINTSLLDTEKHRFLCYLPVLDFESDIIYASDYHEARRLYVEKRGIPYEYRNRIVSRQMKPLSSSTHCKPNQ